MTPSDKEPLELSCEEGWKNNELKSGLPSFAELSF